MRHYYKLIVPDSKSSALPAVSEIRLHPSVECHDVIIVNDDK